MLIKDSREKSGRREEERAAKTSFFVIRFTKFRRRLFSGLFKIRNYSRTLGRVNGQFSPLSREGSFHSGGQGNPKENKTPKRIE